MLTHVKLTLATRGQWAISTRQYSLPQFTFTINFRYPDRVSVVERFGDSTALMSRLYMVPPPLP
jgi:hypothetical protein